MEMIDEPTAGEELYAQLERGRVFEALFPESATPLEVGRYTLSSVLGRGGMGSVFAAFDPSLKRRVAIKVLHREQGLMHTARLRREAQALAALSHPNVVQVYEVGEVDGRTFVAMELVEGRTVTSWMRDDPPPSWRACVEIFIQLGSGLAAAHEQGLVHRDFKPSNAIIDERGRARVLDFGLARRVDAETGLGSNSDPIEKDPTTLDGSLTHTGTVLGTPAYMPPEQMRGVEADARSDQFSFCVSLYEAVYGERPFDGSSRAALLVSILEGRVRAPPRGARAPRSLRAILRRGLALDPDQRWASMEDLLEQLRRLVAPPRRAIALVSALGLGVIGVGLGQYSAQGARCEGAEAQIEGIWDRAQRQRTHDAIMGTERSYALETWERVEQDLDAYAEGWVRAQTEACEATRVTQEQTEQDLSLRMSCLRERKRALQATVAVLGDTDASTLDRAVNVVAALPRLERCGDLEALRQTLPPPEDPEVARRVEQLREQLAEADALYAAADYSGSERLTDEVVAQDEQLGGYPPLLAEALMRRGDARSRCGQYDAARDDLERALSLAVEHGHHEVEFEAIVMLTYVIGVYLDRYEAGHQWGVMAKALAERPSADPGDEAVSLSHIASIFRSEGKLEQALDYELRALDLVERVEGKESLWAAKCHDALGGLLADRGQLEQSLDHHQRALSIRERRLGPGHPSLGVSWSGIGRIYAMRGRMGEAIESFLRALEITRQALGPDHPEVGSALSSLAGAYFMQEDLAQAQRYALEHLRLLERTPGASRPDIAAAHSNLGNVLFDAGQLDESEQHYRAALVIAEAEFEEHHPQIPGILSGLGRVHLQRGELGPAREYLERALSLREVIFGKDHHLVANLLGELGSAEYLDRRFADALPLQRRAAAIFEQQLGAESPNMANILNTIGLTLRGLGRLDEARDHHERALSIWERALGPDNPELAWALIGLAEVEIAQQHFEQARAYAERALSVRDGSGTDPNEIAESEYVLARVLWENRGERASALALAERALQRLNVPGEEPRPLAGTIQGWLAERGG